MSSRTRSGGVVHRLLQRLLSIVSGHHRESLEFEVDPDDPNDVFVVVDHQDVVRHQTLSITDSQPSDSGGSIICAEHRRARNEHVGAGVTSRPVQFQR